MAMTERIEGFDFLGLTNLSNRLGSPLGNLVLLFNERHIGQIHTSRLKRNGNCRSLVLCRSEQRSQRERKGKDRDQCDVRQQTGERPKPQPVHVEKKVGRNDPCPCGSGKKYKNCCGRNED